MEIFGFRVRRLKDTVAILESFIQASPLPIVAFDPDGIITIWNKAAEQTFGWTAGEVIGHPHPIVPQDKQHEFKAMRARAMRGESFTDTEARRRRRDGSLIDIRISTAPLRDADGRVIGIMSVLEDITERKKSERRLAYLATHDPLTGLANRRSLEDVLKRAVAKARRGRSSSLILMDVDNFKIINDTLGHWAGDRALIVLTEFLSRDLRVEDLMARLGGDEFGVLLEGAGLDEARIIAERMCAAMDDFRLEIGGRTFRLGLSMGLMPIDGTMGLAAVLSQADAAMYRAKEAGRRRVVLGVGS